MRLISSSKDLEKTFCQCINKHEYFSCMVAWAGVNSIPFTEIQKNERKITQVVVGTHFYQTHPDFIEALIDNRNVKFMMHTDGVFHPKVYLFYSSSGEFDLLIGSANLTNSAFTINVEIATHLSNIDIGAEQTLNDISRIIDHWFNQAEEFSDDQLKKYRAIWRLQQNKLDKLSGRYGGTGDKADPFFNSPVAGMSWRDFMRAINDHDLHGINERLLVLDTCRNLFESVDHFSELDTEARKFIAGLPNNYPMEVPADAAFFGSMRGRGDFAGSIGKNHLLIAAALDQIPIVGEITRMHYDAFVHEFKKLFPLNYLGCATRLMAMKRPDIFYCLTSANRKRFCVAFGLPDHKIDYEVYWDGVIGRLNDCPWYVEIKPENEVETRISRARAAFLDAIYYEGHLSQTSNK